MRLPRACRRGFYRKVRGNPGGDVSDDRASCPCFVFPAAEISQAMPLDIHNLVRRGSRDPVASLERISAVHLNSMPFRTALSLQPVIEYWEQAARKADPVAARLGAEIQAYLDRHPELRHPIEDVGRLDAHRSFLQLLLSVLFPPAFGRSEAAAALVPFEYRSIYATPAFEHLFSHESGMLSGRVNLDLRTFTYGKTVSAYLHILRTVYDIDVAFEYPVTFTTQDAVTGLDRHYKVTTDLRFVRIKQNQSLPELDGEAIRSLVVTVSDVSEWMGRIPPSSFEFYGMSIVRAFDVTDERMIALLERDLVEEGNLVNRTMLPDVEQHVRTLLRQPQLELGLAAVDGSDFYLLNEPAQPIVDTFFTRSTRYDAAELEGSIFGRCMEDQSIHVTEDLSSAPRSSRIDADLLRWGVRNVIVAPLFAHDDRVGVLYVWSRKPASLHTLNVMKLLELLPMFSAAVRRAREEMRNRVRNVIMGQYTAIHPSVEWRFREAALHFIQHQEQDGPIKIEPIVFETVYPLFAATDIRSSSEHRNRAVQHDLSDHLEMARGIIARAHDAAPSPMLHHLLARVNRYRASLEVGFASSDEAAVRDFIQADLEPVLMNLRGTSKELDDRIAQYLYAADLHAGTLYERSRAFERSVEQINQTISDYLDAEQAKIQPLFPHYFEKHQTDGVDFTIYAGDSLLEDERFEDVHVPVLRLWQLMVLCGIAVRVERLRVKLDVPLETTHLILVQNTPISIRYRFDETRFDVDGPHHVRFEIMKQRVEKAHIKATTERLTQPDQIAIVYSQEREIREYRTYVDYLQTSGIITSDVERVDLDDLQGMKGLRALRVRIGRVDGGDPPAIVPEELARIAGSVTG